MSPPIFPGWRRPGRQSSASFYQKPEHYLHHIIFMTEQKYPHSKLRIDIVRKHIHKYFRLRPVVSSYLMKLGPDERTDNVNPWSPDGAKKQSSSYVFISDGGRRRPNCLNHLQSRFPIICSL